MSTRETILARVRAATDAGNAADSYARLQRGYMHRGALSADERVALMAERLREYDAVVAECEPDELEAVIMAQVAASGKKLLVVPPKLPLGLVIPAAWKIEGLEWTFDHELTVREIEEAEGVLTMAFCGIAESGTIVLHHSASEGRRVLTLLPDWHLCVLYASQIVEVLPEYFARCAEPSQLATFIAGPSATADIEMTRVKGVHGPRFLHVVVVRDDR